MQAQEGREKVGSGAAESEEHRIQWFSSRLWQTKVAMRGRGHSVYNKFAMYCSATRQQQSDRGAALSSTLLSHAEVVVVVCLVLLHGELLVVGVCAVVLLLLRLLRVVCLVHSHIFLNFF
jgi:hypothetical protein